MCEKSTQMLKIYLHSSLKTFNIAHFPLHTLSNTLSSARRKVHFTDQNEPVVPALLDQYSSSLVAPDHLLLGLAQDILRGTIALLSPQARYIADVLMRRKLSCNFLGEQMQIINPASASINATGTSDLFAVLLIAPICFENALYLDGSIREENDNRTDIIVEMEKNSGKRSRGSRTQYALPPSDSKTSKPSTPGLNASEKPSKTTNLF
jgi:hypothetical protein